MPEKEKTNVVETPPTNVRVLPERGAGDSGDGEPKRSPSPLVTGTNPIGGAAGSPSAPSSGGNRKRSSDLPWETRRAGTAIGTTLLGSREPVSKPGGAHKPDDGAGKGTSEAGVRGRVNGDPSGRPSNAPRSDKTVSSPENVDRVKEPKPKKPEGVAFLMQEGATKGKKSDLAQETVKFGVEMAFSTAASLTDHDWWEVTSLEANQIAAPLARVLNRMDPVQRQLFERYFDPIMLLLAVGMVVTPRLKAEVYLREEAKRLATENRRPNVYAVGASEERQTNGDARANAVFRRRDVIENFRQGD